MTREDAIDFGEMWLELQKDSKDSNTYEFFVMALKALKQKPKTGHWVEENINKWSRKVFCSECGGQPPFEYVSTGDVYSASGYGVINKTKFCPNCGTRMEEQG